MLNWFRKQKTDPRLPAPEDEHDRRVLGDIKRVGWSVLNIEPDDPTTEFAYSFSVGMYHTHGHPEIIVVGLPHEVAGTIINTIGAFVILGNRIEPDRHYDDFTNAGNVFKVVHPRHYEAYCGYARWLYRNDDFPMLQMVWPLKSGHYPWDDGYPSEGAAIQPLLV